MTILYYDPFFLEHETGSHPERPARLEVIKSQLENAGLVNLCKRGDYTPLTAEQVQEIHHPQMIELVRQTSQQGGGYLEADTVVSSKSYEVGLAVAGVCVAAVDEVMAGEEKRALCLVRPPGHHATPYRSMGFCLFNSIALAAHHARHKHGLNKILIVDWDVHHGNGTQDIFYADGQIGFLSIHRYGNGFYPGTGAADETGTGKGLGFTWNVPLRHGISRSEYQSHFRTALEAAADIMKPEIVLLSAGFDAHAKDPVGSLGLESEDFSQMTMEVLEIAKTHAQGRLVSCLEGGYHLQALAESVRIHLEVLLDVHHES